jgi:phosphoserine phosphatase
VSGIRLLSSDLNGTLVKPHTMQEMITLAFPREPLRHEKAKRAFSLQTQGLLSMEKTFQIAGEATAGLTLRAAIEYTTKRMAFVNGYAPFMDYLQNRGIHLAVISTGYSVTIYAIRHSAKAPSFDAFCNRLLFSEPSGKVIGEEDMETLVKAYLQDLERRRSEEYDRIRSNGEVILGIRNEEHKARLALDLANSLGIAPSQVAHMGDTMGDSGGILGIAKTGGLGIAFNYNQALEAFLLREGKREIEAGNIVLVDPKGPHSRLTRVLPFLERTPSLPHP